MKIPHVKMEFHGIWAPKPHDELAAHPGMTPVGGKIAYKTIHINAICLNFSVGGMLAVV